MRALVTGCAGFIGSHLTESLLADGHWVIGVDRDVLPLVHERFEPVVGDLLDLDLVALTEDVDVIYHLAGEPGLGSSAERYRRNNVEATRRLPAGTRLVYASSSSVYGDAPVLPTGEDVSPRPLSPYGASKLAAERLCSGGVALRYFSVYGPRQRPDMAFRRFCEAIVAGRPIELFGDGTQTRDFTYVDDVVAATRAAGELDVPPGSVFNVGGGAAASLNDVLELLAEIAGRPLDVRRRGRRSGEMRHTAADITRARAELGYAPRTALREGLEAQFEWVRSSGAVLSAS